MAKKKAKVKAKVNVKEIEQAHAKNLKETAAKDKAAAAAKAKLEAEAQAKAEKKAAAKEAAKAPKLDTTLLDSLLAATGEKAQGETENLKDFCYRLFVAMVEVPDDKFKALPKAARDWYDTNSDRYNAEKFDELEFLPGMHGFKAEAAAAEEAEQAAVQEPINAGQENTKETDMTKAKAKNKGMEASATPKAPEVAKEKGERKPQTESVSYKMRSVVVKNPLITFEKAADACGLKGKAAAEGSHAFNYYNHARIVIAMFKEHAGIK